MGANVAALYSGIRPQRLKWLVNLEGIGLRKAQPAAAPEQYATWLDEIQTAVGRRPLTARFNNWPRY